MRPRRRWNAVLRVFAALGLIVLSPLPWLRPVDAGAQQEIYRFFFPWVPNGEEVNDLGPWYGKLSFLNLDDRTCAVSIFVAETGGWVKTAQLSITSGSSRSMSAGSLGVPAPGSPVRLEALCPVTASVKMVTPDVISSPWSDGAMVVTGYTGLSDADIDAAGTGDGWFSHLPIVQTNSGWNSVIRVSNAHPISGTSVTVRLFSSDDDEGDPEPVATVQRQLPPAGSTAVDVLSEVQVEGWVGFAEIEASGPVGAQVLRSKPSTRMALTNVATSGIPEPESDRYILAAPLLFNAYNGWNTGINLANVSGDWANVTIRYYVADGGLLRETELQLAPRSMQYLYTPHNLDQEGFVGSAVIESDRPVSAAIDEVKYETGDAISYLASSVGQKDAAVPIAFREDPRDGRHDNSGINIQNLNPDAAQTVEIQLITIHGGDVLPMPFHLTMPPAGNNFVYLPSLAGVPPGTLAAARITSQDEYGFVAISNNVNYAVPGDGSVTFMAAGEAGYYRLLGSSGQ